jgi:hypothetical protein
VLLACTRKHYAKCNLRKELFFGGFVRSYLHFLGFKFKLFLALGARSVVALNNLIGSFELKAIIEN